MRAIFWNIRGFGHAGRRSQLKEYVRKEGIDIVALHETIKSDFRHHDLLSIGPLERFSWYHLAANGHSGGMLLGFDQAIYEVIAWDAGTFFLAGHIRHRQTQRELVVIQVYGLADHARSAAFLAELQAKVLAVSNTLTPLVVGATLILFARVRIKTTITSIGRGCPCSTMRSPRWVLGK